MKFKLLDRINRQTEYSIHRIPRLGKPLNLGLEAGVLGLQLADALHHRRFQGVAHRRTLCLTSPLGLYCFVTFTFSRRVAW